MHCDYGFPIYSHVVTALVRLLLSLSSFAKQFPKANFIIGHMGFADQEAIDAAKSLPNFFLGDLNRKLLEHSRGRKAGSSKVIFGSEFPLSHPSID